MFTIYVKFKCVPGKREEYIKTLKAEGIVDAIRKEDGCIKYEYYFAEENPDEILLVEAWESKKHQEIHIEQPHMGRMRELKPSYVLTTELGEFELK